MKNYCVQDLIEKHGEALSLELVAGRGGIQRRITVPEVHRPGLNLAGFFRNYAEHRIHVLGKIELHYMRELDKEVLIHRLHQILTEKVPCVIVARKEEPPEQLSLVCEELQIPLFKASMSTMNLITRVMILLNEDFSPRMTCHGTLVEVFGIGILIQGDSSVGKSEAALGLIERGHRLITDDVVRIRVREGSYLEGSGPELTRHLMEIRGIGIINVAHLYGAVCIRREKSINLVVKLEEWDDNHFYDRIGLDEKSIEMLGIRIPLHTLPVKPGRDVVLLLETIALNHRLKELGYHSAREFNVKLLETIQKNDQETCIAQNRDA